MAPRKKQAVSAQDLDRIIVRLPEGMRTRLSQLAYENGRSMTAEVVAALERHLQGVDRITEIWNFIDKQRENIESIAELWSKVERLESMVVDHDERFNPLKYDRD